MTEQEIIEHVKDTCNTERTFSVVSAQLGIESSTTSELICDISDRLKRLSHELGTEVQGRIISNKTRRGLQCLEEKQRVDHEDGGAAVAITVLTMVMKNLIEKERVEREKTDNDIETQINKIKRELAEEKDESENDSIQTGTTLSPLSQALSPLSQASDTEVRSRFTSWSTPECSQTI